MVEMIKLVKIWLSLSQNLYVGEHVERMNTLTWYVYYITDKGTTVIRSVEVLTIFFLPRLKKHDQEKKFTLHFVHHFGWNRGKMGKIVIPFFAILAESGDFFFLQKILKKKRKIKNRNFLHTIFFFFICKLTKIN